MQKQQNDETTDKYFLTCCEGNKKNAWHEI
jgi:hypothetical protein